MRMLAIITILLFCSPLFATGLSAQMNYGYGYIEGKRHMERAGGTIDNKANLKALGTEAGIMFAFENDGGLGGEIYFDYLFAKKGSFDPENAPEPSGIEEMTAYTDYKAGLGIRYVKQFSQNDRLRLACGLNFAGVSNHHYYDKEHATQYDGNKVTSFGLYVAASGMHKILDNLFLSAGIHTCLNPVGIIRNFNASEQHWYNYFPSDGKARVKCFSGFIQVGLVYSFNS